MHPDVEKVLEGIGDDLIEEMVQNFSKERLVKIWDRFPPENWDKRIIDWYETLFELIDDNSLGGTIIVGPEIRVIFQCTFEYLHNIAPTCDIYPAPVRPVGYLRSMRSGTPKKWEIIENPLAVANKIVIENFDNSIQEIVINHLRG